MITRKIIRPTAGGYVGHILDEFDNVLWSGRAVKRYNIEVNLRAAAASIRNKMSEFDAKAKERDAKRPKVRFNALKQLSSPAASSQVESSQVESSQPK